MRIVDLLISGLGPKGDGIYNGSEGLVFVDRALPGDKIKAKVERDSKGIYRGEILKITTPSPYRQEPPCIHFEKCGNCTLQHLQDKHYRDWKFQIVKDAFRKQGLSPKLWQDTVFIKSENRRRVTFTVIKKKQMFKMGFNQRRSQQIFDLRSCLIMEPVLFELHKTLRPFLISVIPEGKPVDVFIQKVGADIDLLITGPIGRDGEVDNKIKEKVEILMRETKITRFSWRFSELSDISILKSKKEIICNFGKLNVAIPPAAFLQPTVEGEKALVKSVMSAMKKQGKIADLFSGCGTFTGHLLEHGAVDAYEIVPSSIKALSKSIKKLPLRVFKRDLFRHPLSRQEINRYDTVVFDPPRGGCEEQVMQMASSRVPQLIGVSCNPATFARDAKILCRGGYKLQSLQVVDQFVWSHHVEMVGVFTK